MADLILAQGAASPSDVVLGTQAVVLGAVAMVGVATLTASADVSAGMNATGVASMSSAGNLRSAVSMTGVANMSANADYVESAVVMTGAATMAAAGRVSAGVSMTGMALLTAAADIDETLVQLTGVATLTATAGTPTPPTPVTPAAQGGSGPTYGRQIKNPFAAVQILGPTEEVGHPISRRLAAYEAKLHAVDALHAKPKPTAGVPVPVAHHIGGASLVGSAHHTAAGSPRARSGCRATGAAIVSASWSTYTHDIIRDEEELLLALATSGAFDD